MMNNLQDRPQYRTRRWSLTESSTRLSPLCSGQSLSAQPALTTTKQLTARPRTRRISDPGGGQPIHHLCPIIGVSPHRQTSVLDCDIIEDDETINFPSSDICEGRLRSPRRSVISSPRQRSNSLPAAEADFRSLFEVGEALGAILSTSPSSSNSNLSSSCQTLQVHEEQPARRRSSVSLESCSLASIVEENSMTAAAPLVPVDLRPSASSSPSSSPPPPPSSCHYPPSPDDYSPSGPIVSQARLLRQRCDADRRRNSSPDVGVTAAAARRIFGKLTIE